MIGKTIIQNTASVLRAIHNQVNEADKINFQVLQYVGEEFIRRARENREFKDDTGNLQSSIGYAIIRDKNIVFQALKGIGKNQTAEGKSTAERLAKSIMINIPTGWALIGLAGMEYGIYVEARGTDVISGSIPAVQKLMREVFRDINKLKIKPQ